MSQQCKMEKSFLHWKMLSYTGNYVGNMYLSFEYNMFYMHVHN